jgi:membrane protease YdiL (CAAX protease family)
MDEAGMPIPSHCPACHRQISLEEELIGRPVRCVACGAVFTVGAEDGILPLPPAPVVEEAEPDFREYEPLEERPSAPKGPPGPGFWMALVWWLAFLFGQMLVAVALAVILLALAMIRQGPAIAKQNPKAFAEAMMKQEGAEAILFAGATGGNLVLALLICWLLFRAETPRILGLRGMSGLHFLLVVMLVLPLQIVAGEIASWGAEVLPSFGLQEQTLELVRKLSWVTLFIAGCILPGVGEEIYFRGFLSRGLVARHGVLLGSCLASLLFGLMHLDPVHVVGTVVIGAGIQVVFLATRSLTAAMLLHTLNNTSAFLLAKLQDPNAPPPADNTHLPPLLVFTGLAALLTLCLLFYHTRVRWVLGDGSEWNPGYFATETPPPSVGASPQWAWPRWWSALVGLAALVAFGAVLTKELLADA